MDAEAPYTTLETETAVVPPPGYSSHVTGNTLVIQKQWLHTFSPWLIVVVFVLGWIHSKMISGSDFLFLYILFCPVIFYLFLAVLFNVTTIQANLDGFVVQTRPFPLGSSTSLTNALIQRVYWQEATEDAEDDETRRTFFKVSCDASDGSRHDILGRLADRGHAEYISKQLDNYYQNLQQKQGESSYGEASTLSV